MGNHKKAMYIINFEESFKYPLYMNDNKKISNILINGVKTNYFIRSDGKVFSSNHMKDGYLKERKLCNIANGYLSVHISVLNKSYTLLVHRLVAGAFIPNPLNKPEVNHKDGDKTNNKIINLEWATEKENINHAYDTGLIKIRFGEKSNNPCITKKQAKKICKYLEENKLTYKEIAQQVGCTKSIVKNIKERLAWLEISEKYNIDNYDIKESTNGNLRMNKSVVCEICEKISSGHFTMMDIAKIYNIPYSRVNDIKQGVTWRSISRKYDFSNYKKFI